MSVSEARAALPRVLDLVIGGEEITITRHGQPVAVVVRPDALRARRAGDLLDDADALHQLLASHRRRPLPEHGIDEARAQELLAELGRSRQART